MIKTKNILNSILIISFALLTIITNTYGQEIITSQANGYYAYQGEEYKIVDLGATLHGNSKAYVMFDEGKRKYKSAKTLGVISIAGLGLGALSFSLIERNPETLLGAVVVAGPNVLAGTMGVLFVGTGAICGISYLIRRNNGMKYMQKAIHVFNSKNKSSGQNLSLKLGLSNNGAGLTLNF